MRRTRAMIFLAAAAMAPVLAAGGATARTAPAHGAAHKPARGAAASAFPYLRWPGSVVPQDVPVDQPIGHFRFWDGSALQDVEGHTYLATLVARRDSTPFDAPLLRRTIEGELARLGATRLAAGRMPASVIATINAADRKALAPGLGDIASDPVQTWTFRRPHRQVWVQYSDNAKRAALAVVEAKLN